MQEQIKEQFGKARQEYIIAGAGVAEADRMAADIARQRDEQNARMLRASGVMEALSALMKAQPKDGAPESQRIGVNSDASREQAERIARAEATISGAVAEPDAAV